MKKYFKLIRIHHYIKNIIIFLPLIFSGRLFELELLIQCALGFLIFGFLSSAVYIINDIRDIEHDSQHAEKSKRPLASGAVSKRAAILLLCIMIAASALLNYLSHGDTATWFILAAYLVLNLGYSFGLKNIPILDIAILVSGYLLRLLFGSDITDIEISKWLYLTIISVSFYLGLGKRRNELLKYDNISREVLKSYNHNFLDKNMYMCLALSIVFYSLWSIDPVTVARISSTNLIWTVPIAILLSMRYSLIIERGSSGDPVEIFLHDKVLISILTVYCLAVIFILYIKP